LWDGSRESILKEMEESLTRLGTDYVDLYLVHYSPARLGRPMEETIRALQDIKASGKARYVGVSNYVLDEMEEAVNYGPSPPTRWSTICLTGAMSPTSLSVERTASV
jgi:aryl-alcohol dehydrogenase-like predicted oxidoreductase